MLGIDCAASATSTEFLAKSENYIRCGIGKVGALEYIINKRWR